MDHARTISIALATTVCLLQLGCMGRLDAGPRLGAGADDPSGPGTGPGTEPGSAVPPVPGDRAMRRITAAEYTQTVLDVLETTPSVPLPEDLESGGLSRQGAGAVVINPLAAERYESAARDVARRAFSDPTRARRLLGCSPAGLADATCARVGIERLGAQLFRRPLTDEESSLYTGLALEGATHTGSFDTGFALALSGLLQSPRFLHHVEIGEPIDGELARRRYGGLEMAARLASFLWSSVPDEALLEDASSGALFTEEGLLAALDRMLRDPRARAALLAFFDEHLGLDHLESAVPDAMGTVGLAARMREELHRLLIDAIFEAPHTRWRDLFDADTTFVDATLAAHYGLPAPSAPGFSRVSLPPARRGLLTLGAVVASHGHGGSTSPTLRGLFVRQRLLCGAIPPPPAGVATTIDTGAGATARERLARHATDPTCAGCHGRMDPIGFGLEQLDARGTFRTHEGSAVIDPSGELDGLPFEDAGGLGELLRDHPETDRCLVRHLFRSAVGRAEIAAEEPIFAELPAAGMSVRDMLAHVITSDGFRTFEP
jgi:hypothetical protein